MNLIFDKILLVVVQLTCLFIGYLYTSILSFFPWGQTKSYFIWGLLIYNIIIPLVLAAGILRLFFLPRSKHLFQKLSFFIVGILLYLPFGYGFDSETDLWGRWLGVITAIIAIVLLILDKKKGGSN